MSRRNVRCSEYPDDVTPLHVVPDVDEWSVGDSAENPLGHNMSEFVVRRLKSSPYYATVLVSGVFSDFRTEREDVMSTVSAQLVGREVLVSVSNDQLVTTFNILGVESDYVRNVGQWLAEEFNGEVTAMRIVDVTELE